MKHVKVRLQTSLKRYAPDSDGLLSLVLKDDDTVHDLLKLLDIKPGAVGLVIVDGEVSKDSENLPADATVEVYPIFGGG